MKSREVSYFNIGPRLKLTFAILLAMILGGNGLLLWQFHLARLETDRLISVNEQVIAVLRFQESLLSFHQRLDELARFRNADRLASEAAPLLSTLLEQIQRTRSSLTNLPAETLVDPTLLPTLEAIQVTLPSQLEAISQLAASGDWEAVQLRLAHELKPLETHTSALVKSIDRESSEELERALVNMRSVQLRIFVIVPATAICSFLIATFLGWATSHRMIDLRLEERVNERTRLARELHDTLLQTIQGSKMVADDALEAHADLPRIRRAMEQLAGWLGQASQEGRAALHSLRTSTIQTNDLAESFRLALDSCRIQGLPEADFVGEGTARDMHPIVRDEIYRIGYEAIRNACHHSGASHLEVRLAYAQELTLSIHDNGKGIDTEIATRGKEGHFGLQGMRERARRIGGKLTLNSSPGSGTRIQLVVPGSIVFRAQHAARWGALARVKRLFTWSDETGNLG